ncbi:hypothetical protein V2G26_018288 [Clonostachys chloroleuca]
MSTIYPDQLKITPKRRRKREQRACLTCKKNHEKCDMEKPFCERCRRKRNRCGGYSNPAQDSDSPVQHKQQQVSPYAASYIPGSYDGPQGSSLLNLLNTSQRTPTGSTLLCVLPMSSANGNSQRSGSGMLFSPAVFYNADAWAGNQKPTHIVGSQGRPDILATVPDRPDAPTSETGQSKNTSMPVTDADRKFTCPVCEKFRSHASDLEHHLRRHSSEMIS